MSATPIPGPNPNDLVTTTRGYLDGLNTSLIVTAALSCCFFVLLIVFFYTRYRTPKESWDIKKASNGGKMVIMVQGLDKYGDMMPVNDFLPEGVKESEPMGKGAKKLSLRWNVPKSEKVSADLTVDEAAGKTREATAQTIQALYNLNTEPAFLRKAKIPFLIAMRNSVAAVSLKFLGVQTFLTKLERIQKDGTLYTQIKALKKSRDFAELGAWLEDLSTGVSVVDFQTVYSRAASVVADTLLD